MYLIEWDFWFPLEEENGFFDVEREVKCYEESGDDLLADNLYHFYSSHKTMEGERIPMRRCWRGNRMYKIKGDEIK